MIEESVSSHLWYGSDSEHSESTLLEDSVGIFDFVEGEVRRIREGTSSKLTTATELRFCDTMFQHLCSSSKSKLFQSMTFYRMIVQSMKNILNQKNIDSDHAEPRNERRKSGGEVNPSVIFHHFTARLSNGQSQNLIS